MRYFLLLSLCAGLASAQNRGLQSADFLKMRSVGDHVSWSPDGSRIAYTISNNDGPRRPYSQLWIMTVADGKSIRLATGQEGSSTPVWSPDGQWVAYEGHTSGKAGLIVAHPDGSGTRYLGPLEGTNAPLPTTGNRIAWSPDGKRIAFVSAVPGPETAEATGDPIVIRRYLYKPDAAEGNSHFNDNKRLHIFEVEVASGKIRQLTNGLHYEHSIDWSPDGNEIAFISNREPNEDQFFNYDLFALNLATGAIRRLTTTENSEYKPHWSPDGKSIAYQATRRGLTDLETTMEDTHVWLISADGKNRREIATIDNRQGEPMWSADGSSLYFTVQERGNVRLYKLPTNGAQADVVIAERGTVGSFSVAKNGAIAYAFTSPSDMAQLYVRNPGAAAKQMTKLNESVLAGKELGEVEAFTFISNDNKFEIEGFLTKPVGDPSRFDRVPLIVNIHGGPHGQQGPAFQFKNQVYAGRGWATLMVNYRGSTGYGQKFADAVFGDQNGNEGQDVIYGVSAAIRRNVWIDRDRMGVEGVSYGGQLSDWLITQTNMFRAAIPIAGISNLVSYNYMTYYNQYEQMEFGIFPHQGNLMDLLWQRSALKYVAQAHTPTLLMHGENDNDVPIAEAEQYYVALRDVGVETVMVRYPREGHGIRESKHQVDSLDRCIDWYEKHFTGSKP